MLSEKETIKISRFLSLVLRHKPETIVLKLDENGWADVEELIGKMNMLQFVITKDILNNVVENNNKQRFSFNGDKTKIRANQGHSISVDLQLKNVNPPEFLYHGTSEKVTDLILKTGVQKGARHYVHLSADIPTAITVGKRHGKPKVFIVAARQMHQNGYIFYLSKNNVWLTDYVPATYLRLLE